MPNAYLSLTSVYPDFLRISSVKLLNLYFPFQMCMWNAWSRNLEYTGIKRGMPPGEQKDQENGSSEWVTHGKN